MKKQEGILSGSMVARVVLHSGKTLKMIYVSQRTGSSLKRKLLSLTMKVRITIYAILFIFHIHKALS